VQSVTLKTDLGDIKIEVFCEAVPKSAEARRVAAWLSLGPATAVTLTWNCIVSLLACLAVELSGTMCVRVLRRLHLSPVRSAAPVHNFASCPSLNMLLAAWTTGRWGSLIQQH